MTPLKTLFWTHEGQSGDCEQPQQLECPVQQTDQTLYRKARKEDEGD